MDFDCWTGLLIEGKPYTIVEKIRYREKASDVRWTEYGLITGTEEKGWWLSVMDGGLSCTLSRTVPQGTAPKQYRLRDQGKELVVGVWGVSDASVGDEASYREYESEDGKYTFFLENWAEKRIGASGWHVDPAQIRLDPTAAAAVRANSLKWEGRKRFLSNCCWVYAAPFLYVCVLFLLCGDFADTMSGAFSMFPIAWRSGFLTRRTTRPSKMRKIRREAIFMNPFSIPAHRPWILLKALTAGRRRCAKRWRALTGRSSSRRRTKPAA